MKVREAVPKDCESLEELYKELSPDLQIEVLPQRINEFLVSNRDFILVYEFMGKVIGTLTVNICLSAEFGKKNYAVFENFIISEEFRRKGIGSELLEYGEQVSRDFDCEKIILLSSSKRVRAHKLFEKLGFDCEVSKGFKKYLA